MKPILIMLNVVFLIWAAYALLTTKPQETTEVIKYVGPELTPVSGCFITEDQFLICKLGE